MAAASDLAGSAEFIAAAVELAPEIPSGFWNLGVVHHQRGRLDLAAEAYAAVPATDEHAAEAASWRIALEQAQRAD